MGVGTRQGLAQGHFYYFQAVAEERGKSATDYLTHSHNVNQPGLPIASQIQYEISVRTRG